MKSGSQASLHLIFALLFSFSIQPTTVEAQTNEWNSSFIKPDSINSSDTSLLRLRVKTEGFFKNNEYFNDLVDGYTLIGSNFIPTISYQPNKLTRFTAGGYFKMYYGYEKVYKIMPLLKLQVQLCNDLQLSMGYINGGLNHGLIEPIYKSDRHWEDNPERGVQLVCSKEKLNADVWLNWENFALKNANVQEELSFGFNVSYRMLGIASGSNLSMAAQGLVYHKGGQLEQSDASLQTLENVALGIKYNIPVSSAINKISFNSYFVNYADLSITPSSRYLQGYGSYSEVFLHGSFWRFMLGYWHGTFYQTPKGENLFESVSQKYQSEKRPYPGVALAKASVFKNFAKGVKLELRAESYFDWYRSVLDYSYGLHIIFDNNFFITKCKLDE